MDPYRAFVAVSVAILILVPCGAGAGVPAPLLEGPVSGGAGEPFVAATTFDLAQVGYVQEEFFVSGSAVSYTSAVPLGADGVWSASEDEAADYKTRILVHRPEQRERFNGTVLVEWLNVSGGLDAAPDWILAHTELIRRGYAWVGVSAQRVGVEGGGGPALLDPMPLKEVDPARYGTLDHPGDSFSYDIFSQVGRALLAPPETNPLGDLEVERLLAAGQSQSAFRLVVYINAVDPLARIYDGFLVHSRGAVATPLAQAPQTSVPAPGATLIRPDVRVPVLMLQMETDVVTLQSAALRQPDGARYRLWEVAGTGHADYYVAEFGASDLGRSAEAAEVVVATEVAGGRIRCEVPINSGPQHFVTKAAVRALDQWVAGQQSPTSAERLELAPGSPIALARDPHGIARGGIRTPHVDAPVATLSGLGQTGSILCVLFGSTTPFDATKLYALYPYRRSYNWAVRRSVRAALDAGFLLPADARLILQASRRSEIGDRRGRMEIGELDSEP